MARTVGHDTVGGHLLAGEHHHLVPHSKLRERDLHPLKEDLLTVAEVGGLLGRGVCVRRTALPLQAAEFARSRNLLIVLKERLVADLRSALFPNEPASLEQLRALAAARTRA